jgi:hypothetical protein
MLKKAVTPTKIQCLLVGEGTRARPGCGRADHRLPRQRIRQLDACASAALRISHSRGPLTVCVREKGYPHAVKLLVKMTRTQGAGRPPPETLRGDPRSSIYGTGSSNPPGHGGGPAPSSLKQWAQRG